MPYQQGDGGNQRMVDVNDLFVNFNCGQMIRALPSVNALNDLPPNLQRGLSPSSGRVGSSVTINGTNFGTGQGTSTVTFNGVPATATNWNQTQIRVTVPSGASTGNVVVTVSGIPTTGPIFTVQ